MKVIIRSSESELIRSIEVLEDLWAIKTREVERLLKMRQGSSNRERISLLRQQIIEIEEKLLNLPKP